MRAERINDDVVRLYGGGIFDGWTEFSWSYLIEAEPKLGELREAVRSKAMKPNDAADQAVKLTGPRRLDNDWATALAGLEPPAGGDPKRWQLTTFEAWLAERPQNKRLYGEAFRAGWPYLMALEVGAKA